MANTPVTPTVPGTSLLDQLLMIMNLSLQGLSAVPVAGSFAGIADAFLKIFIAAKLAHEAQTGQPLNFALIPIETPVVVPPLPAPAGPTA